MPTQIPGLEIESRCTLPSRRIRVRQFQHLQVPVTCGQVDPGAIDGKALVPWSIVGGPDHRIPGIANIDDQQTIVFADKVDQLSIEFQVHSIKRCRDTGDDTHIARKGDIHDGQGARIDIVALTGHIGDIIFDDQGIGNTWQGKIVHEPG